MKNQIITNIIEHRFPPAMRSAGYVFMGIGLLIFFNNIWLGTLVLLGGLLISFGKDYVQLKPEQKQYRSGFEILGWRWGNLEINSQLQIYFFVNQT